jgi:hypothetical protein
VTAEHTLPTAAPGLFPLHGPLLTTVLLI